MKHRRTIIAGCFVLLSLLATKPLLAQDSTRTITLKEAIDLSIKNSKLLKNNKAKIDEATAVLDEAHDKKLPDFSVTASYLYLPVNPDINLKSSGSDTGKSGFPSVHQAMYGIANASLPIFTGGKIKYGIESAKYLEQAAKLDADDNREAVVANTINAFSNLYKAKATVAIVQDNLNQSNQRVSDFSDLEKNGLVARNDLLKVELQSSNIELTLLDAQSNYKLASVNMDLMLGLPEQTILSADSASLIQQNADIKTIDEYEKLALQSRKDLAALSFREKAAGLNIKTIKADYYPSVAITGGYVALDVPNFVSVINAVDIGVGVQYNLASLWKTKSKLAEATAKVQELNATEDMLNDNIRLQINQAYQTYLLSQKKIEVYQKAIDQANENYRITKNKYDNSLATTTDLLDADVAQLQAKLNASNAAADAVVAYDKLLQTAGLLNN